jgi:hypothetical protein
MDWLSDGIVGYIVSVYEGFFTNVSALITEAMKTPSGFNTIAWKAVSDFHNNAVLPVSWMILTLFLLFDLVRIIRKYNAHGSDLIYCVSLTIFKIGLSKMVMENSLILVDGIFEISTYILSLGKQYITTDGSVSVDVTRLTDTLDKTNIVSLLGLMISSFIINLANSLCNVLSFCVVRLRFIEIYVMTAISSLPLATLPNEEYKSIAINYIKRLAGLATHAVFIVIVLYLYAILVTSDMFIGSNANALDGLLSGLGYSILMVIALFQTGGWAKSVWSAS